MAWADRRPAPRVLTVLGIPIHIDASWLIIVALVTWSLGSGYFPASYPGFQVWVYWAMGLVAAVLLFVCVLLHELGHSLTAQRYGIPVTGVVLFIFGGVAQIAHDPKRPSVEFMVAIAGPLVSVVIAALCFWASSVMPIENPLHLMAVAIVRYLAVINTFILLFNLLPGFPLDGGRILRAGLWAWTGSLRQATRVTGTIGSILGMGLIVFGVWMILKSRWITGFWYIYLGGYLRNAARRSYQEASAAPN